MPTESAERLALPQLCGPAAAFAVAGLGVTLPANDEVALAAAVRATQCRLRAVLAACPRDGAPLDALLLAGPLSSGRAAAEPTLAVLHSLLDGCALPGAIDAGSATRPELQLRSLRIVAAPVCASAAAHLAQIAAGGDVPLRAVSPTAGAPLLWDAGCCWTGARPPGAHLLRTRMWSQARKKILASLTNRLWVVFLAGSLGIVPLEPGSTARRPMPAAGESAVRGSCEPQQPDSLPLPPKLLLGVSLSVIEAWPRVQLGVLQPSVAPAIDSAVAAPSFCVTGVIAPLPVAPLPAEALLAPSLPTVIRPATPSMPSSGAAGLRAECVLHLLERVFVSTLPGRGALLSDCRPLALLPTPGATVETIRFFDDWRRRNTDPTDAVAYVARCSHQPHQPLPRTRTSVLPPPAMLLICEPQRGTFALALPPYAAFAPLFCSLSTASDANAAAPSSAEGQRDSHRICSMLRALSRVPHLSNGASLFPTSLLDASSACTLSRPPGEAEALAPYLDAKVAALAGCMTLAEPPPAIQPQNDGGGSALGTVELGAGVRDVQALGDAHAAELAWPLSRAGTQPSTDGDLSILERVRAALELPGKRKAPAAERLACSDGDDQSNVQGCLRLHPARGSERSSGLGSGFVKGTNSHMTNHFVRPIPNVYGAAPLPSDGPAPN